MSNKYFIAKLNINGNIFTNEDNFEKIKMKLIPKRILSFQGGNCPNNLISDRNVNYTLADIKKVDEDIIFGKIVKLYNRELEHINEGKTIKKIAQDGRECIFFYSISKELFLLEKSALYKGGDALLKILEKLISNNNSYEIGELSINLIKNTQNIEQILKNDPITKITFNYIHPNDPNTLDQFSKDLKNVEASKAKMELSAPQSKKLNLVDNNGNIKKLPQEMINYSGNGSGDLTLVREDGSEISSKNKEYAIQEILNSVKNIKQVKDIFKKIKCLLNQKNRR